MGLFRVGRMEMFTICFCFALAGCNGSPEPDSKGAREAVEAGLQEIFTIWVPVGSVTVGVRVANGYGDDYEKKYPAEYGGFIDALEAQGFLEVERPEESSRHARGVGSRVLELKPTEEFLSLPGSKPLTDDWIVLQVGECSGVTVVEALPSSEAPTPGERSWWVTGTSRQCTLRLEPLW